MVQILALWTKMLCLSRLASPGFSSRRDAISRVILSFISEAAALVNVTTSRRSISTGCSGSVIIERILCTKTNVLPLPAAALTKISQSR